MFGALCYNGNVAQERCALRWCTLLVLFGLCRAGVDSRCDLKRANIRALDAGIHGRAPGYGIVDLSGVQENSGGTFRDLFEEGSDLRILLSSYC